ncbi:MAG: formate dehydrogenase accessory sulfurtransferase FdhD [Pseudomonadota bacterium]|jgi:FdhD protein
MTLGLAHPAIVKSPVSHFRHGAFHAVSDRLAAETPVAIAYNCEPYAVMMATPADLEDFAYGFSLTEGIVADAGEILAVDQPLKDEGVSLLIEIPPARASRLTERARNVSGRTGCGVCGIAEIEEVLRPLPALPFSSRIGASAIDRAVSGLPALQKLNSHTGAVHAAGFATADGELLLVREDVGRHNALDKLIGAMRRSGRSAADGMVLITSRCSMEMVQKTVLLGCPMLVAVSAPTSLAVKIAEASGLTIAAFARGDGCNVYTHVERVR